VYFCVIFANRNHTPFDCDMIFLLETQHWISSEWRLNVFIHFVSTLDLWPMQERSCPYNTKPTSNVGCWYYNGLYFSVYFSHCSSFLSSHWFSFSIIFRIWSICSLSQFEIVLLLRILSFIFVLKVIIKRRMSWKKHWKVEDCC
jgi:hypothetical protein